MNRDCPAGAGCLLDQDGLGSCALPADHGCASGAACLTPLVCAADQCVNTCTSAAQCPSDGECAAVPALHLSLCVTVDHDAGVVDASTDGALDAGVSSCAGGGCDGALAVGLGFACAIRDGVVWCWGDNRRGQLGDGISPTAARAHMQCGTTGTDAGVGSDDCSAVPVMVRREDGSPLQASAVACSDEAACAITIDGDIACWGGRGLVPESGDAASPTPQQAHVVSAFGRSFVQLVAGAEYFCATKGTGGSTGAYCWGSDDHGQFGTGDADHTAGEGIVPAGAAWARATLAAGSHLTCMLDGTAVSCAGQDDNGGVGPMGTIPADRTTPALVPFTTGGHATRLVAGDGFACALLSDDQSLQCWGWGASGSLGRDAVVDQCAMAGTAVSPCDSVPSRVAPSTTFDGLWSGGDTSNACARDTNGQMWCWGYLGPSDCPFSGTHCHAPERAAPFDGALTVAMGADTMCALFAGGRVACVGYGDLGQLGGGQLVPRTTITRTAVAVCFTGGC